MKEFYGLLETHSELQKEYSRLLVENLRLRHQNQMFIIQQHILEEVASGLLERDEILGVLRKFSLTLELDKQATAV